MGFTISVNDGGAEDKEAWTVEYDADEIIAISVQSAGGEVARVQVDNASPGIRLEVTRRSTVDSTYLDIEDLRARRELSTKREEASKDAVAASRKEAAEQEAKEAKEAKAEAATEAKEAKAEAAAEAKAEKAEAATAKSA